MKPINSRDFARQDYARLLSTPVGEKGSGAVRYAAAMKAFNCGLISVELLEIYRQCSKFDTEDPVDLARYQCVDVTQLDAISQKMDVR